MKRHELALKKLHEGTVIPANPLALDENRRFDEKFKGIVKGFMIESFLEEGSQKHDEVFGKSITDPCIGWADTERLLLDLAEQV